MKCFLLLRRTFAFAISDKRVAQQCERVIRACHLCQAVKKKANSREGTLDFLPIPEDIFSSICMDFLQLPTCTDADGQEFYYALVVVCRLSGYVLAIPCLKRGLNAEKVARMFLRHV